MFENRRSRIQVIIIYFRYRQHEIYELVVTLIQARQHRFAEVCSPGTPVAYSAKVVMQLLRQDNRILRGNGEGATTQKEPPILYYG